MNTINSNYLLLILISYLIGSIPSAILVSKAMKLKDPRTFGSKNPGATNMLRTGSKMAAIITLIGDMTKGYIPLEIIKINFPDMSYEVLGLVAISILLGHIYPLFTKFIGGKGVATFFGILISIEPILAIMSLITWLVSAKIWNYSSLSSIITSVISPIYYYLFDGILWQKQKAILSSIIIMSLILLYRHKNNVINLLNKKENKIK